MEAAGSVTSPGCIARARRPTAVATAHGSVGGAGAAPEAAIALVALVGSAGGAVGIVAGDWAVGAGSARLETLLAGGLVILGVGLMIPATTVDAVPAVGAAAVGGGLAWAASRDRRGGRDSGCPACARGATPAAVGVALHRAFEGALLGVAGAAGGAVGLLGVVVLAGHGALETGLVGAATAAAATRRRGVATVIAVQTALVGGAFLGGAVTLAVPDAVATPLLALVGGAVLVGGLAGLRIRRPPGGTDAA